MTEEEVLPDKAAAIHSHPEKADASHTHSPAAHTHPENAAAVHTHPAPDLSGYSLTSHTHTGFAATSHTHPAPDLTGYVQKQAGASPTTPAVLTGTLGTVGTALVAAASTYSATVATNLNANDRRLMDAINVLRAEVEAIRVRLVSAGLWSA